MNILELQTATKLLHSLYLNVKIALGFSVLTSDRAYNSEQANDHEYVTLIVPNKKGNVEAVRHLVRELCSGQNPVEGVEESVSPRDTTITYAHNPEIHQLYLISQFLGTLTHGIRKLDKKFDGMEIDLGYKPIARAIALEQMATCLEIVFIDDNNFDDFRCMLANFNIASDARINERKENRLDTTIVLPGGQSDMTILIKLADLLNDLAIKAARNHEKI